mmetsp:Transcript_24364/g.39225  ORF Transcript_24364/g.39225 Transcript_24364/m.39225 type:complete len:204 (-) Transcript_24364:812-1423(-)
MSFVVGATRHNMHHRVKRMRLVVFLIDERHKRNNVIGKHGVLCAQTLSNGAGHFNLATDGSRVHQQLCLEAVLLVIVVHRAIEIHEVIVAPRVQALRFAEHRIVHVQIQECERRQYECRMQRGNAARAGQTCSGKQHKIIGPKERQMREINDPDQKLEIIQNALSTLLHRKPCVRRRRPRLMIQAQCGQRTSAVLVIRVHQRL